MIEKIREKMQTPIKKGKTIFIIVSLVFLAFMIFLIVNKFYVKQTICENYPYLNVVNNNSENLTLEKFYSNFTIPSGKAFCIGNMYNKSVFDKIYNITYEDPTCNGTLISGGKTYPVYCSNEKNLSVLTCGILINCTEQKTWKWKTN